MFRLGRRSKRSLEGVNPDLVAVVERAIQVTAIDFVVLEGLRSIERQRQLVAKGASRTMRSRHLTGHAVDLGAILEGELTWRDAVYHQLAPYVKQAAKEVGVAVEWGFDMWKWDCPHWQLPWDKYP